MFANSYTFASQLKVEVCLQLFALQDLSFGAGLSPCSSCCQWSPNSILFLSAREWQGAKRCEATSFHKGTRGTTAMERSLIKFLQASDADLIHVLRTDAFVPDWEGHVCPACEKGTLSTVQPHPRTDAMEHRCNARGCNVYLNPHPICIICLRTVVAPVLRLCQRKPLYC